MLQIEVTQSDGPEFIGIWEFQWNKIVLGGPKGLRFCSLIQPPITLSIYKNKYVLFESEHYVDGVWLDGRKVSFPFVVPLKGEVKTKFFTLIIRKFSLSQYDSLEENYKKSSSTMDLHSIEASFIKKILEN